jgi:multiple sugar transport system permease protein
MVGSKVSRQVTSLRVRAVPAVRGTWRKIVQGRWGYFFLLPSLVPFMVFFVLPLLRAVRLSLSTWRPGEWEYVGLANYLAVLRDPVFAIAMKNTAIYAAVVVLGGTGIALLLSVLIFPLHPRWQALLKGAFYLPLVISAVVVTMVWAWLYNPAFGLFNHMLSLIGVDPVVWLGDTKTALPALMLMALATTLGTGVIMITASMANVPEELYDAAKIDGAGGWSLLRNITLPLIRPVLLYLILISTIAAFQIFTPMWLLTRGGPQHATISVAQLIYRTAFQSFKLGPAAAQSILLFFVILIVSVVYFRLLGEETEF